MPPTLGARTIAPLWLPTAGIRPTVPLRPFAAGARRSHRRQTVPRGGNQRVLLAKVLLATRRATRLTGRRQRGHPTALVQTGDGMRQTSRLEARQLQLAEATVRVVLRRWQLLRRVEQETFPVSRARSMAMDLCGMSGAGAENQGPAVGSGRRMMSFPSARARATPARKGVTRGAKRAVSATKEVTGSSGCRRARHRTSRLGVCERRPPTSNSPSGRLARQSTGPNPIGGRSTVSPPVSRHQSRGLSPRASARRRSGLRAKRIRRTLPPPRGTLPPRRTPPPHGTSRMHRHRPRHPIELRSRPGRQLQATQTHRWRTRSTAVRQRRAMPDRRTGPRSRAGWSHRPAWNLPAWSRRLPHELPITQAHGPNPRREALPRRAPSLRDRSQPARRAVPSRRPSCRLGGRPMLLHQPSHLLGSRPRRSPAGGPSSGRRRSMSARAPTGRSTELGDRSTLWLSRDLEGEAYEMRRARREAGRGRPRS
jgi:hypothetical protein